MEIHLAVLSACLAANVQICAPIVLTETSFPAEPPCQTAAPRIAEGWLAGHPMLVGDGLTCPGLSDLPALPVENVADGIFVHQGQIAQFEDSPDGWIANLGFVIGDNSIAVIDAGASRQQGQALYAAVRAISDKPISHLILTHMHPDHVLGADVFREAGAIVIGHARLHDALDARGPVYLDNLSRLYPGAAMLGTQVTLPDQAVDNSMTVDLGGRVLTLTATGPAHTDNDLTVRDSATGTVFTGDLVFRGLTPIVDGSLPGWLDWTDAAGSADLSDGPIIPGHGPVASTWPEAIAAQQDFLHALDHATRDALNAGLPMSEGVPAIVDALQPFAKDWASFADSAARDATAAFKEMEWQ